MKYCSCGVAPPRRSPLIRVRPTFTPPRVVLRQRRDEAAVHRRQDRQICRAVRRLRRLVVGLDRDGRQAVQRLPVAAQPLAEPQRVGAGAGRAVQARLEDGLRQPDVGGHAEALVDEAPLAEERPVPRHVRQEERPRVGLCSSGPRAGSSRAPRRSRRSSSRTRPLTPVSDAPQVRSHHSPSWPSHPSSGTSPAGGRPARCRRRSGRREW